MVSFVQSLKRGGGKGAGSLTGKVDLKGLKPEHVGVMETLPVDAEDQPDTIANEVICNPSHTQ